MGNGKDNCFVLLLDFQSRRRYIGPKGHKPNVKASQSMTESYSATMLTSLEPGSPPCFVQFREQSNTALDFVQFLLEAVQAGFLKRGDILVCDNARIHNACEIQALIVRMNDEWGVQLKFLPPYSPEFNPCEYYLSTPLLFDRFKS
jgi:hypothetical protein